MITARCGTKGVTCAPALSEPFFVAAQNRTSSTRCLPPIRRPVRPLRTRREYGLPQVAGRVWDVSAQAERRPLEEIEPAVNVREVTVAREHARFDPRD